VSKDPFQRTRGLLEIAGGVLLFLVGVVITVVTFGMASKSGGVYVVAYGPIVVGIIMIVLGVIRLQPERAGALPAHAVPPESHATTTPQARRRAGRQIAAGLAAILAGILATKLTYDPQASGLGTYLLAYVPVVAGSLVMAWGLVHFLPLPVANAVALEFVPGIGYRSFVAWRYLLNRQHRITLRTKVACLILIGLRVVLWLGADVGARFAGWQDPLHVFAVASMGALVGVVAWGILRFSKLAMVVFLGGLGIAAASFGITFLVTFASVGALPGFDEPLFTPETAKQLAQILWFVMLGGFGLSMLAAFFGTLRGFFTFFTTVPIGGTWIGTAALVLVLAVMSGFETDLRDKILGSNAHIQVTREDGEFVNWREAKTKIDAIPGVVASTPYAVSEVVIAANNNGMPVIIKGIDPETVAKVTNLVDNLDGPPAEKLETMRRLEPLVDMQRDRTVRQTPRPTGGMDPPPDDMVTGGDPIDFSGTPDDAGAGDPEPDAGAGSAAPPSPAGDPDTEPVSPYGGDATRILELEEGMYWMPDSELLRWFIGDPELDEPAIHAIDIPLEPSRSPRTQALPGILVGKELVKQTHLYTGEEVRVVSPLSDPSNPDATGTPIPFNRDYRVAGIFYTGMYEYDLKYVYVTLDSLQDFLDLGDTVDGIEIRIRSADDTERYVPTGDGTGASGLIRKALGPGYRIQDWRELNRSLFSALKLEKIAMFLVLGIVILVASFSIIGNLIMVVVEKAREIALLKTLGASDTGVMQLFAIQGMIIGLIGTTLGVLTGLAGCMALDEFGLPLDPDVYYINRLPIHIDTQSVIAAAITGVLISIAATLYPALLAARVRPADGMRH
jgi:lipoprotein-releasing system permease protein